MQPSREPPSRKSAKMALKATNSVARSRSLRSGFASVLLAALASACNATGSGADTVYPNEPLSTDERSSPAVPTSARAGDTAEDASRSDGWPWSDAMAMDAGDAASSDGSARSDAMAMDAGDAASQMDAGTVVTSDAVNLGAAGSYVILAKTGVSTVPPSVITGDLGVSPGKATLTTEFG